MVWARRSARVRGELSAFFSTPMSAESYTSRMALPALTAARIAVCSHNVRFSVTGLPFWFFVRIDGETLGVIRFQQRFPDFLHANGLLGAVNGTHPAPPAQICFDNGPVVAACLFLRLDDGAKGQRRTQRPQPLHGFGDPSAR